MSHSLDTIRQAFLGAVAARVSADFSSVPFAAILDALIAWSVDTRNGLELREPGDQHTVSFGLPNGTVLWAAYPRNTDGAKVVVLSKTFERLDASARDRLLALARAIDPDSARSSGLLQLPMHRLASPTNRTTFLELLDVARTLVGTSSETTAQMTLPDITAGLEMVMKEYEAARLSQPFGADAPMYSKFATIAADFRDLPVVQRRPHLQMRWGVGKGNWANVPWIGFLDSRETTSIQQGVYCVFLFSADMERVYLTLNQGVTDEVARVGRPEARKRLSMKADTIRPHLSRVLTRGFLTDASISLGSSGLAADYEAADICHKRYNRGSVPLTTEIVADLDAVLADYDAYVTNRAIGAGKTWIFQANPQHYDLASALAALGVQTWTVKAHAKDMAQGDKVFLWQSGPEGGIVAEATIIELPREREMQPDERAFVKEGADLDGLRMRALLKIERRVFPTITRTRIVKTPGLETLSIIKQPQGTNFPVTEKEAMIIRSLLDGAPTGTSPQPRADLEAIASSFSEALRAAHVRFGERHDAVAQAFLVSLATKRFVILTGLSGSGKTQLALKFGDWIGRSRSKIIPVRPDWTGAEALFGYEDALQPMSNGKRPWHVPDTLAFMLTAAANPDWPHLLILDEMNLAHVERYFADALSGMESGNPCVPNLSLGPDKRYYLTDDGDDRIPLPSNLFVVGTVNVDETTYMFSPKVLDRANTIEFRVATSELVASRRPIPAKAGPDDLIRGFLEVARQEVDPPTTDSPFTASVLRLHALLSQSGFEFGHRVFFEAGRFASLLARSGNGDATLALDLQVLQKVLPRLHGSRRRLEPVLLDLARFCVNPAAPEQVTDDPLTVGHAQLQGAHHKLIRMMRSLRANQFASFAE